MTHAIPSTGTLDGDDLVAIARLESKVTDDQFSDDPTLAYVGREFTLMIPAAALSTEYDKDKHKLVVSSPTYEDGIDLVRETSSSTYTGQNSFGAKAVITKVRGSNFGIWLPGASYSRKPIRYETELDGPAARDLSKALRLRVSGLIVKADGIYAQKNSAVFKKSILSDATISEPYDTWIERYLLAVRFTRAEWIDSRTGAIVNIPEVPAS